MDTPVADEAFVALLAGMRPRRMGVADVQALPEMAILRRSPLAARWMAPMSPFLSAEAAAAATHAAVGVADVGGAGGGMFPGLTPNALAAATPLDYVLRRLQSDSDATGSATSDGGTTTSSGSGGSGGGYPGGDTPVLLLSSISVPIHTDGTVLVGYTISDVHLDAVTPAFLQSDPYPRICRFAIDTHMLQGLETFSRHDGRVVLFNCWRQAGLPLEQMQWIMSAFTRPPAGVSAASGPPFTTLHARKSTLCHRTEAVNAATSRLMRGGNGPERVLDDFRALHDCLGSFGGAAVADDGAEGDVGWEGDAPTTASSYAPGALVTVPPAAAGGSGGARPRLAAAAAAPVRMVSSYFSCTRSGAVGAERLRMLALSLQAVNPLRLRLGTRPPLLKGALGAAPSPPASASGGGVAASATPPWLLPRERPIAPAPRLSPPAPRQSPPAAAAASASTSGDSAAAAAGAAGAAVAAGAGAPAAARLGPARRRPRRKVALADVTDAAAAARILRNRSAAARSNAKRKAARLGALAAAAVVAVPAPAPALPPPPTVGAVPVPLAGVAPSSAAAPLDGGGDGGAANPWPP